MRLLSFLLIFNITLKKSSSFEVLYDDNNGNHYSAYINSTYIYAYVQYWFYKILASNVKYFLLKALTLLNQMCTNSNMKQTWLQETFPLHFDISMPSVVETINKMVNWNWNHILEIRFKRLGDK